MASRDLTFIYSRNRSIAQSKAGGTGLSVPLLLSSASSSASPSASSSALSSAPSAPPHPVATKIVNLTQKQIEFDKKINELAYITFNDVQNEINKSNAKKIYNEIIVELRTIKNLIKSLPENDKISVSLKRKYSIELQENINVFKEQQKKYKTLVEMYAEAHAPHQEVNIIATETEDPLAPATRRIVAPGTPFHGLQSVGVDSDIDVDERLMEINRLARDVRELAQLFNELSEIVTHQGTILDRIDHNMDTAIVHIDQGKTTLATAQKYQQSSQAPACCIGILILGIVVGIVVIILKSAG